MQTASRRTVAPGDQNLSLSELRRRIGRSQAEVALAIGTTQSGVSRLERQPDMLLSTLDEYVSALGGRLRLVVEHPAVSAELVVLRHEDDQRGARPKGIPSDLAGPRLTVSRPRWLARVHRSRVRLLVYRRGTDTSRLRTVPSVSHAGPDLPVTGLVPVLRGEDRKCRR